MRKTTLLFAIILLISAGTTLAQTKYSTYTNDRFGYSIDYPANLLTPQPEADNGDGRIFLSHDKKVEMRVWGNYDALSRSLRGEYRDALKTYIGVKYKILLNDGFVVSGVSKGAIYYRKTLYRKSGDVGTFYTFYITYPESARKPYDAVVRKVAGSLKVD